MMSWYLKQTFLQLSKKKMPAPLLKHCGKISQTFCIIGICGNMVYIDTQTYKQADRPTQAEIFTVSV